MMLAAAIVAAFGQAGCNSIRAPDNGGTDSHHTETRTTGGNTKTTGHMCQLLQDDNPNRGGRKVVYRCNGHAMLASDEAKRLLNPSVPVSFGSSVVFPPGRQRHRKIRRNRLRTRLHQRRTQIPSDCPKPQCQPRQQFPQLLQPQNPARRTVRLRSRHLPRPRRDARRHCPLIGISLHQGRLKLPPAFFR